MSQNKVGLWHTLNKQKLIKNRMFKILNTDKEYFFNNLFKIGYSKTNSKNQNKNEYLRCITKAFQRRFRPELINGKIDKECLLISDNLLK